eukprot:g2198.t1
MFFFFVFLLLQSPLSSFATSPAPLHTLTSRSFPSFIAKNPYSLISFDAPWCSHCKRFLPELNALSVAIENSSHSIAIARCPAPECEDIAHHYGVVSFPTVKWFVNSDVFDYTGVRTSAALYKWIVRRIAPPIVDIESPAAANEILTKTSSLVVFGFFLEENPSLYSVFRRVSMRLEEITFAHISAAEVASGFDDKVLLGVPSVVLYKKFDERRVEFTDLRSGLDKENVEELAAFITLHSMPLVVPFSRTTASLIFGSGIDTQLLIFADEKRHSSFLVFAAAAAMDYKGKIVFVSVPSTEHRVLSYFGVSVSEYPTVRLVDHANGDIAKYRPKRELLDHADLASFISSFRMGKLVPELRSEEVPILSENSVVQKVVAHTLDEVVFNSGKDVFLLFYAPWCSYSKKVLSIWELLGQRFLNHDSLRIAKMDATKNEHARVVLSGFPTIQLWKSDTQKYESNNNGEMQKGGRFEDYVGEYTFEAFVEFIENHYLVGKQEL